MIITGVTYLLTKLHKDMDLLLSKLAFQTVAVAVILLDVVFTSSIGPQSLKVGPPPMIFDDFSPACFNFTHGNYQEMEFYSPGYPQQYPNEIDCVMYLQAPPGFYVDLYFTDEFSIEESEGCKYDFIELRDGPFGYSKFLARFCGEEYPVTVQTKSRFLWTRFSSDGLVQYNGFRAVYEYKISSEYDSVNDPNQVCRIYMDNLGLDGEINSKVFPLADTSRREFPIDDPVDCTWEMLAEKGQRILLSDIKLHMLRDGQCTRNRIEMYDRTTSEDDRTGVYCAGPVPNYMSESNRVYLRILGSRLSEKPVLHGRYTVYRPANTRTDQDPCDPDEFHCDGICLNQALVCNGHQNCPTSGADEKNCAGAASSGDSGGFPLMAIILAGVGGLILVLVVIGVCVMCRHRKGGRKPKGVQKQDSQKRNALELAVSDSLNTAYQLSKQNNPQGNYYSLPRTAGQTTMMQHRGSFSKVPSEGDYGDHMSDSSTYKKFIQLEQNFDDDSSRCPSPYSPGFTTIIEQHPAPPGMTPDLGWNYQPHENTTSVPSLAENLSKLQLYTNFSGMVPKTIPTTTASETPMTMDFRYDPSSPVYPATKFRIKSPDVNNAWESQDNGNKMVGSPPTSPTKSLTFKNKDADVAPDLTREIEAT
ncbi:neuropilin and tolloid-like protein 1 isoform X2 [Mya arenaria]|uniref:neuropilin and tolloid-like protein 1 isoform X2 n=1 Tax=Mya arenaria TaxID=6604 RepID=UPI0022E48FFA|nr:neuropilin and tolloid-like protein 1 isoform X2 [Mya arenaria]